MVNVVHTMPMVSRGTVPPSNKGCSPCVKLEPWPLWAKAVRLLASESDEGVGDTIHRMAGLAGETFEQAFKTITGKDCGCKVRRESFNREWKYEKTT